MIKVETYLDGNQFGCCEYICEGALAETLKTMDDLLFNGESVIVFIEHKTNARICVPITRYPIKITEMNE